MRRYAVLALVLPALAAAGCGSSKKAAGPLDEGLRYLPANAPFAAAIDTNVGDDQYRAVGKIAGRFPGAGQLGQRLKGQFERSGKLNFDRDVKPLLGNPFVVGAVNPSTFGRGGASNEFVGAIDAKNSDKLKAIVGKSGAQQQGEEEGATLYKDKQGQTFAVNGHVLVVAGSRKLLAF